MGHSLINEYCSLLACKLNSLRLINIFIDANEMILGKNRSFAHNLGSFTKFIFNDGLN